MRTRLPRLFAALLILCTACAGPGRPKELARGVEPMTNEDALVLHSAGLDRLMADSRDAGLRSALGMLDDRLLELPAEFGAEDFPLPIGQLVFDTLARPMSLTLDVPPDADWSQGPSFDAQLTVEGSEHEVAELAQGYAGLLAMVAGAESRPVAGQPGLRAFDTPVGTASHGVVGAGEEASFVLALGEVDAGPLGLGSLDLPEGVEPLLAFKLDMGRLQGAIDVFLGSLGMEGLTLRDQLALWGLSGDAPMKITWAYGIADGLSHSASRYGNYVPISEANASLETAPITEADFGLVPADAVSAAIVQSDPATALAWIKMADQDPDVDLIEMIYTFTGVHLEQDIFGHLGTTMGYYTANSSGGGGLMSLVVFVEVVDEAGLNGTREYVFDTLDDLATAELDGRVDFRTWDHGGAPCSTLTFPGWPVPFELSFAITDGFLFFTLSPQALAAAIDQRRGGGPGLLANEAFLSSAAGRLDDLTSVTFVDTERRIAEGYGTATLLTAALANGVRSPDDPTRDPGLVLPPFPALAAGAVPSVALSRIEGDDLVTIGRGDPSVTANLVSFCGGPLAKVIGVGLFAITPLVMLGTRVEEASAFEWEEFEMEELSPEEEAELLRALSGETEEGDG